MLVLGWSPNTRTLRAVDGQRGRNLRLDWVVKAMALGREHAVSKWAPGRVDPCDHGVLDRRSWAALIASSWIGSCNHAQRGLAGFESEASSPCCKAAARNRITGGGGQSTRARAQRGRRHRSAHPTIGGIIYTHQHGRNLE